MCRTVNGVIAAAKAALAVSPSFGSPGDVDHGEAHRSGQVQQGTPFRMVFVSPPGSGGAACANVTRNTKLL